MNRLVYQSLVAGLFGFGVLAAPSVSAAQSAPPQPGETIKAAPATSGSTDIAKGGYVTSTAQPSDEDPKEATTFNIAGGGLFSAGNSKTVAFTSSANFRMRRDEHQLSVAGVANYAKAAKKGEGMETTVENYQGLLRYDYFFNDKVSLFLQSTGRYDRFQGLDLRLNIDPGVAYYFINTKLHRLQGELGYDFQYDIRRNEARVQPLPDDAPAGTPPLPLLDKTQALHNSRLFVGYENSLRKEASIIASGEYLQNFADFDRFRLIFTVGLKSNLSDKLAIATTYTLRYENKPLPTVEKSDQIAAINLVYTFL